MAVRQVKKQAQFQDPEAEAASAYGIDLLLISLELCFSYRDMSEFSS